MKKTLLKIVTAFFGILIGSSLLFLNSCEKEKNTVPLNNSKLTQEAVIMEPAPQNAPITQILSVSNIRKFTDGTQRVSFNKNEEVFDVADASILSELQNAYSENKKMKVTFDPWRAFITKVSVLSPAELQENSVKKVQNISGIVFNINKEIDKEKLDNSLKLGIINTSTPGLTNVVPDMATAQLMFNYLTKQCCALSGPYGVDHCISYQYAEDGCYARAHKMCYVLNNKYHYATHKIFSFANAGSDVLSVQAQKWGGCCINWWYHVAPLVNVNTPTGVKAFVFDPAMFDQPVLLSVWLHAQENPVCASWGTANVSMINIQPTASYSPADGTGFVFDTDPLYSDTNSTLVAYSNLISCP